MNQEQLSLSKRRLTVIVTRNKRLADPGFRALVLHSLLLLKGKASVIDRIIYGADRS